MNSKSMGQLIKLKSKAPKLSNFSQIVKQDSTYVTQTRETAKTPSNAFQINNDLDSVQ